jgi:hypothetical protein
VSDRTHQNRLGSDVAAALQTPRARAFRRMIVISELMEIGGKFFEVKRNIF